MLKPTWTSRDGTIALYLGDCLHVLNRTGTDRVDAVVTDPPYGVGYKYKSHDDSPEGYREWCHRWFSECMRVSGGNVLMSVGATNLAMWMSIQPPDWVIAWIRKGGTSRAPVGFSMWEPMPMWGKGSRKSTDMFTATISIMTEEEIRGHPCPKPVKWASECLLRIPGKSVLDPFMGSGTMGVACARAGRPYIGIEKEPDYFHAAVKRIESELHRPTLLRRSDFEAKPFVDPDAFKVKKKK